MKAKRRANLLRIAGIGVFYLVELLDYHGLRLGSFEIPAIVSRPLHQVITGLALAWALTGMAVLLCQKHHIFPAGLKYATTAADLVFLTLILLAASGPQSPLVIGYFLIIVLATLRFSLGLIRFATAGAVAGYLAVLGHGRWFRRSAADRAPPPATDHGHRPGAHAASSSGKSSAVPPAWPRSMASVSQPSRRISHERSLCVRPADLSALRGGDPLGRQGLLALRGRG